MSKVWDRFIVENIGRMVGEWKSDLWPILSPESIMLKILESWDEINKIYIYFDEMFNEKTKQMLPYRNMITEIYCHEYLSEYLRFIFDNLLKFEEIEVVSGDNEQTFVQFIKTRFSPPPLFALCRSVIIDRVPDVNDLKCFLPDNVMTNLKQERTSYK